MTTSGCPACGVDDAETASPYFLRCSRCGLWFDPAMQAGSPEWYAASHIYQGSAATSSSDRWEFGVALEQRPASILDAGCGTGTFLERASKITKDVHGFDFSVDSLALARKRAPHAQLFQSSVESFSPGSRRFAMVTAFEVVEHVAAPLRTVVRLSRALTDDGTLVISVPCIDRWPRFFDPVADRPPHHLTLWTEQALRMLLSRAGFEDVVVLHKPLSGADIGMHVKWRLQRLRGRSSGTGAPSAGPSRSVAMAKNVFGVGARALRVVPGAGSFTLAAIATRRSDTILPPSE